MEADSGNIVIDGVDTSKISLQQVRQKITIIPQEPTLFKGTLRYNLDPLEILDEKEIVALLKQSGLDDIINKKKTENKEKKEKERKEKEEKGEEISDDEDEEK